MSVTPHADAVVRGMAEMRRRYASEPAACEEHDAERRLTLGLTEIALIVWAEKRDLGVQPAALMGAFTVALSNVVASVADTAANADRTAAMGLLRVMVAHAAFLSEERLNDPEGPDLNTEIVRPSAPAGTA